MPTGYKLTTEDFIKRAKAAHGDRFTYEESQYVSGKTPINMTCKIHGLFTQLPSNHMKGIGCRKCGRDTFAAGVVKVAAGRFVANAVAVHGDAYDYSDVIYKTAKSPISIRCNLHGTFEQTPNGHLSGKGCRTCANTAIGNARRLTQGGFLSAAEKVHGGKYDYSLAEYTDSRGKVDIVCAVHGVFQQGAMDHMMGRGCPVCSVGGYKRSSPGSIYIMTCGDLTKVGITNNCPTFRAKNISTSYGKVFTVAKSWAFEDGGIADDIETRLLASLKSKYKQPTANFEGYTECFLDVDMASLINEIESEINQETLV